MFRVISVVRSRKVKGAAPHRRLKRFELDRLVYRWMAQRHHDRKNHDIDRSSLHARQTHEGHNPEPPRQLVHRRRRVRIELDEITGDNALKQTRLSQAARQRNLKITSPSRTAASMPGLYCRLKQGLDEAGVQCPG
jgi:hypothetical protein